MRLHPKCLRPGDCGMGRERHPCRPRARQAGEKGQEQRAWRQTGGTGKDRDKREAEISERPRKVELEGDRVRERDRKEERGRYRQNHRHEKESFKGFLGKSPRKLRYYAVCSVPGSEKILKKMCVEEMEGWWMDERTVG